MKMTLEEMLQSKIKNVNEIYFSKDQENQIFKKYSSFIKKSDLSESYFNNPITHFSQSEIWLAVSKNDTEKLKQLLDEGENPNGNSSESPPLMIAVANGNMTIIQMLVEAGCDVNAKSAHALYTAVNDFKKYNIAIYLIQNGASWRYIDGLKHCKTKREVIQFIELLNV